MRLPSTNSTITKLQMLSYVLFVVVVPINVASAQGVNVTIRNNSGVDIWATVDTDRVALEEDTNGYYVDNKTTLNGSVEKLKLFKASASVSTSSTTKTDSTKKYKVQFHGPAGEMKITTGNKFDFAVGTANTYYLSVRTETKGYCAVTVPISVADYPEVVVDATETIQIPGEEVIAENSVVHLELVTFDSASKKYVSSSTGSYLSGSPSDKKWAYGTKKTSAYDFCFTQAGGFIDTTKGVRIKTTSGMYCYLVMGQTSNYPYFDDGTPVNGIWNLEKVTNASSPGHDLASGDIVYIKNDYYGYYLTFSGTDLYTGSKAQSGNATFKVHYEYD